MLGITLKALYYVKVFLKTSKDIWNYSEQHTELPPMWFLSPLTWVNHAISKEHSLFGGPLPHWQFFPLKIFGSFTSHYPAHAWDLH